MDSSFWWNPVFLAAVLVTLGAVLWAYVYLPRQIRKAYRQALLTLARAVETKDIGYLGHGERVAELVAATVEEMHIPREERRKMEYAAFLQDIGNVRVPHAYLNKAEELTPEELEVVKTHTAVGAEIVDQVQFLREIAPIMRHHHEAWDGSGYPDGLAGEDIPLGARIIAVCTAFDSMIHIRAYRPPMDEEQAVLQLRADSGTKYDPAVVDAFLRMLKKRHSVKDQRSDA